MEQTKQQAQVSSFFFLEPRRTTPEIRPQITWEIPSPDFEIPDEPMDNFDQSLLAEALRDALHSAHLISKNQLCATSLAVCVNVGEKTITKAPDWFYVPYVYPTEDNRRSYTPNVEGQLPTIVMEFLSDYKGKEYDNSPHPPYGKWYFYETILKVPWYVIFDSSNGVLEVYHFEGGSYKIQTCDKNGHYWIDSLGLFLGVFQGLKEDVDRNTYWLRWWDIDGNQLLWQYEKAKQIANETTRLIAKRMLQAHAEIAFIQQVTGLDEVEIHCLRD